MRTNKLRVGILAAAMLVILAACGGTSTANKDPELASVDTSTPADTAEVDAGEKEQVDPEEAFALYDACLAEHGVTVEVGGGGAEVPNEEDEPSNEDFTLEELETAQAECGDILDDAFGSFDVSPEEEAELADDMLALQTCLSDKGFEVEVFGNQLEPPADVDPEVFNEAFSECASTAGFSVGGDA